MNLPRAVNLRRFIVIAVVLLALSVALLFWARDVVQEVIVLPLSYLFWLIGLLIRSTPQIFFWMALLLITFMMAYRSLRKKRKIYVPLPVGISEIDNRPEVSGRVSYWLAKERLLRTDHSRYFRSSFHNLVGRLLIELLAHRYRLGPNQVEERLRDGSIRVPEQVQEFALSSVDRFEIGYGSFFKQLWQSIVDWVRFWLASRGASAQSAAVEPQMTDILNYMEEELEVSHDDSGR